MPRIALDLNKAADRRKAQAGDWKVGLGFVPGEGNEGLVAQSTGSPARLADYDDSGWPVCNNVRQSYSKGFTFAWYRITVQIPERVDGAPVAGSRVWFETSADNYGEVWVNGELDRAAGSIIGLNGPHRLEISNKAVPGEKFVIACLVANGPLGEPRGGVFLRYTTLAFESAG
ncbi:MAG: hypothetical protein FJ316_05590 [SAR202 cluster bacterium]|nr:hypothetical protein [SAR202 cluster bacterium]